MEITQIELDTAIERAESAETMVKELQGELRDKEREIDSLEDEVSDAEKERDEALDRAESYEGVGDIHTFDTGLGKVIFAAGNMKNEMTILDLFENFGWRKQ